MLCHLLRQQYSRVNARPALVEREIENLRRKRALQEDLKAVVKLPHLRDGRNVLKQIAADEIERRRFVPRVLFADRTVAQHRSARIKLYQAEGQFIESFPIIHGR